MYSAAPHPSASVSQKSASPTRLCFLICLSNTASTHTSPSIGVGVGIKNSLGVGVPFLIAFCAGALFFVGANELVLPAIGMPGQPLWMQLAATWVGFGGMSVLALWV